MPFPRVDYTGHKFGLLTIMGDAPSSVRADGTADRRVNAMCDCGNAGNYQFTHLRSGTTKSCGCLIVGTNRAVAAYRWPPQEWMIADGIATAEISGRHVIVDATALGLVHGRRWTVSGLGYVKAWNGDGYDLLHRLVMGVAATDARMVDHRNGDKLDNRRCALRFATALGNARNAKKKWHSRNKYKGYTAKRGKYEATIYVDSRRVRIGSFATEEEAARAYDAAAVKHYGEFARTNFVSGEA